MWQIIRDYINNLTQYFIYILFFILNIFCIYLIYNLIFNKYYSLQKLNMIQNDYKYWS